LKRFHETVDGTWGQFFDIERMLYQADSAFQSIHIFQNRLFGRVLTLDGVVQTTEADEHLYHEMLVHVPLFSLDTPAEILIIGGGDGGTAREVLKHPVARVTMVEIDGAVIEACRTHMPGLSAGAFDDARLDLIVGDGIAYVQETDRRFDAILIDSTDPAGPGEPLFSDAFYAAAAQRLTPDGLVVAQLGMAFLDGPVFAAKKQRLAGAFPRCGHYEIHVPTYTGGPMGLGWAGHGASPDQPHAVLAERLAERLADRLPGRDLSLKCYSARRHRAALAC